MRAALTPPEWPELASADRRRILELRLDNEELADQVLRVAGMDRAAEVTAR